MWPAVWSSSVWLYPSQLWAVAVNVNLWAGEYVDYDIVQIKEAQGGGVRLCS